MQQRRVGIAKAMGVVMPQGLNVDDFFWNTIKGENHTDIVWGFDISDYPTKIASQMPPEFDPVQGFSADDFGPNVKDLRIFHRPALMSLLAIKQTLEGSGLLAPDEERGGKVLNPALKWDIGIFAGTGGGLTERAAQVGVIVDSLGIRKLHPLEAVGIIFDGITFLPSVLYDVHGPNDTFVAACASSAFALGYAYLLIKTGRLKAALVVGVDSTIGKSTFGTFCRIGAMSKRNDDPRRASRPFDRNRDGFIMGEGAGCLLLLDTEFAAEWGIPVVAEVLGHSHRNGGNIGKGLSKWTFPSLETEVQVLTEALRESGLSPDDIGCISAHGTSTPGGDEVEIAALKQVLGKSAPSVPVTSVKSVLGHTVGASAVVETICFLKGMEEGIIPPTYNVEDQDPECDMDVVPNAPRKAAFDVFIKNSFGFGNQNASFVVRRVR